MDSIVILSPQYSIMEPLLVLGVIASLFILLKTLYDKISINREYSKVIKNSITLQTTKSEFKLPKFEVAISAMNDEELKKVLADKNQTKKIIDKAKERLSKTLRNSVS